MQVRDNVEEVVAALLLDDMSIAVGGFGLCGIPQRLIEVVQDSAVTGVTIVSNKLGVDGKGLGLLLERIGMSGVRITMPPPLELARTARDTQSRRSAVRPAKATH